MDFSKCFTDPKQFIRLIVLLLCVFITVYQLLGCLHKLLHPPVSTYNKLILNETIKFPAITVCRKPAFKSYLFPKYGLEQRAEISSKGAFKNFPFDNITLDYFMDDITYSLNETVYMYGYDGLISNPNINILSNYYMQLGCCYTFKTDHPASKLSTDGGIFVYFNNDLAKGMTDFSNDSSRLLYGSTKDIDGFYIYIHDPVEAIADLPHQKMTYSQSLFLEAGESVHATLQATEFDMVDRSDERCESNTNYSQTRCNQRCLHNRIMREYDCSLPWLKGDVTYPRCTDPEVIDNITSKLNNKRMEYINSCECPMGCHIHFYFQKIVQRKTIGQYESMFSLYYDTSIITVVEQVVTYNFYSFVADLGGSIGLFLGLSLIGLIEIMEVGCSFLYVKCKRNKNKYHT